MFKIHLDPSGYNSTITYNGVKLAGITKVQAYQKAGDVPCALFDIVLAQLDAEVADGNIRFNVKWPDGTLVCTLKPEIPEYVDGPRQWFVRDGSQ